MLLSQPTLGSGMRALGPCSSGVDVHCFAMNACPIAAMHRGNSSFLALEDPKVLFGQGDAELWCECLLCAFTTSCPSLKQRPSRGLSRDSSCSLLFFLCNFDFSCHVFVRGCFGYTLF